MNSEPQSCGPDKHAGAGQGPCLGIPPIDSGFPAIVTARERMRCCGKSGRSCSPD